MLILPLNARKFKECLGAGQLNQILSAILRQNFKTPSIVELGKQIDKKSAYWEPVMMPRDPVATTKAVVNESSVKKLATAISIERRAVSDPDLDRSSGGTPLQDLSNFDFCPLSPSYFDFALNRGSRGQQTRVFEVSSWNSEQARRFRVKN